MKDVYQEQSTSGKYQGHPSTPHWIAFKSKPQPIPGQNHIQACFYLSMELSEKSRLGDKVKRSVNTHGSHFGEEAGS